jgi:hypothetical protein
MLRKVNMYFFDQEELCLSDYLWFYGFYSFCGLIAVICLIANIQTFFI